MKDDLIIGKDMVVFLPDKEGGKERKTYVIYVHMFTTLLYFALNA